MARYVSFLVVLLVTLLVPLAFLFVWPKPEPGRLSSTSASQTTTVSTSRASTLSSSSTKATRSARDSTTGAPTTSSPDESTAASASSAATSTRQPSPEPNAAVECLAFGPAATATFDCRKPAPIEESSETRDGERYGAVWAIEAGNVLALLHGDGSESSVSLWAGDRLTRVGLGPLTNPVGGTYHDGLLYVACFGSGVGDNGLAILDVAEGKVLATHVFPDSRMYVHNAFAFMMKGNVEIFVAILGNPWSSPPLPGLGLVRFDRTRESFELDSTIGTRLNARSAKQQPDGSIFVLTQEPANTASRLARLEPDGKQLHVVATVDLPSRTHGGEGGADVNLGAEVDTVWVSDRQEDAPGKLHLYSYSQHSKSFSNQATRDLGIRPRFTAVMANGDIISCNQDSNDLSVYNGLANHPFDQGIIEQRVQTVASPMFLLQTTVHTGSMVSIQV